MKSMSKIERNINLIIMIQKAMDVGASLYGSV